jgi:Concanavalin A-like lectin/glucanases superfamily/Helix-turn-helix domain
MTKKGDEPAPFDWVRLVPLTVHPMRVTIIEAIDWIRQPLSSTDMARILDEEVSVSYLSYHFRELKAIGAIEVVRTRQVRGAYESFYCFPHVQGSAPGSRRAATRFLGALLCLLLVLVGVASALASDPPTTESTPEGLPNSQDILSGIASPSSVLGPPESTDPSAAEGVPHRDLDRTEALEIMQGVFGPALQAPAGILDELEVERFLSPTVAVVPAAEGATAESEGAEAEGTEGAPAPDRIQADDIEPEISGATLLTSTVPLQAEAGAEEPIDLSLVPSGSSLEPANPATDLSVPTELGDGIELPGPGITIELADAPEGRTPTTVDDSVAFYPNVAEDTDFAVAPTATGVETLTQIRSAESPQTQSLELDIPAGADLQASANGGATVSKGDELLLGIAPPIALDAAGQKVPVSLDVAGNSLVLHVSPDETTQFPILLDPLFQTYEWRAKNTSAGIYNGEWKSEVVGYEHSPDIGLSDHVYNTWVPLQGGDPGLFVTANGEHKAGDHSNWLYPVPRYFTDNEKYKVRPTSYIAHMTLSNLVWHAASFYLSPYVFAGIWDPTNNGWVSYYSHESLEGHSVTDMNWQYQFPNENPTTHEPNTNAKVANVGVYATENRPDGAGEVYVGTATIELGDQDVPQQPIASGPSGWANQTAVPLTFTATDTGLGVSSVNASTEQLDAQGKPLNSWKASYGCTGVGGGACPRTWKSSEAGHPALNVEPALLPSGINYLNVIAEDPVGNKSTASAAQVKVDHTAPQASLSGTVTEQATLGVKQPSYTVKATASDGTAQSPQSGATKVWIEVDGTEVAKTEKSCATENCSLSVEWTLESRKYSAGTHTVKVFAKDAVANTSTAMTKTIELQPDATAPSLSVTGSITEQASLGTSRPQYKLKMRASDGTLAEATAPEGGPAAAYALDETSGTSARDASGSHTGTVTAPTWVEGKYGKALSFNGTSSCLSVPNSLDLQLSGAFTLSAWVKPNNVTQWAPIFYKEAESFYSYSLFFGAFEAGHIQGYVADHPWEYTEVESPGKLTAGTWAHVAMTSDGTTLRLYVNGAQVDTSSAKAAMESKQPLLIGCAKNFGEYFNGTIDNVRVFNRALTASEIETDKGSAVKVPAPEGPTAAYAFDETSGTAAKDAAGAHNATVSGTASWVEGKYGKALNFNGENTCASVANGSDLQLNGPFTLEAWVKPANTSQWAPIFYKEAGSFYGYSIFFGAFTAGHIQGYISEHAGEYTEVESPGTLAANTWAHVAMTSDGTTMRLYVNGAQVDTSPASKAIATTGPLLIGCAKNFGEYFKGAIDNVRVFNRALTAAEVEADKTAAVGTSSGPMQSGIAKTEITLDGNVVDSSSGCPAENCAVAREWTLSSAGKAGKHTVVTKVTDGFGNTTAKTTEIEVQPDTTKPAITTGGALSNAPSGWVEQEGYGFTASAKDAGYGVTSLALKIDGTQVASSGASCADGGCEATVQKTIEMGAYSGGAHPAEVVASDGAGNTSTQKWTINVDPEGHISTAETTATLEAVEKTSDANLIGDAQLESIEGTTSGLTVDSTPEGLAVAGSQVPTEIATQVEDGVTMQILKDGVFGPPCAEGGAGLDPEGAVQQQCAKEEQAGSGLQPITVTPSGTAPSAGSFSASGELAGVAPNTGSHVDTVQRPLYDGSLSFQDIRDASATETFVWDVALEPGQHLALIDPDHAQVYYASGHLAFGITAEPAHDAVGTTVASHLSVAGNSLTLTVNHRAGSYVYPVVAGVGWEGGFASTSVQGPKDEQEVREERERLERELREAQEQEWTAEEERARREEIEQQLAGIEAEGSDGILTTIYQGPPRVLSNSSSPSSALAPNIPHRSRAYRFNQCHFSNGVDLPVGTGGKRLVPNGTSQQCHGSVEWHDGTHSLLWAYAIVGIFDYKWNRYVWLPKEPICVPPWGPRAPVQAGCFGPPVNVVFESKIDVIDRARWDPGAFGGPERSPGQYFCGQIDGVLSTAPPPSENRERLLFETMHFYKEPIFDPPCSWTHLD